MERHPSVAPYVFWGLLTIVTASVDRTHGQGRQSDAKEVQGIFTPELDHCTLDVEGHTVKAVHTHTPKLHEHAARHLRITIDGSTVVAFKAREEKPLWTANAPGAIKLVWLAADEKVIYLSGYKVEKKTVKVDDLRPESPLRVRRLELDSGKWLGDLTIGERPSSGQSESILGLRTKDGRVVVLTGMTEDTWDGIYQLYSYDMRDWITQMISYRVSCFKTDGAGHPWSNLWSKAFSSTAKVGRSVAVPLWDGGAVSVHGYSMITICLHRKSLAAAATVVVHQ